MASLDSKSIIKAKLFGALTEPSGHLKVEEGNCIIIHIFLMSFLFEAYAVWNATSSLDYFVDHVITDRAVLERDDIDHTVSLHCVLGCKFLVEELGLTQLRGLLGLPKAYV